ncbi:MAG: hypothetical protein F6J94_22590 [Moorea sp. SIO1F2]|uniref:hypothetical protein n=1 Tax=Moorena sp. SIO1F2 TaxID=2607819 RepID=UPI0013BB00A7|nr:hypothetical protein [Moorena sp. SIO1F2]NET84604.1 hypothetical protein [Moorena sp. SIO1F2]
MELADTNSDFVASTTYFNSQTGYKTFTYEFTTAGTFTLSIGVVDMADSTVFIINGHKLAMVKLIPTLVAMATPFGLMAVLQKITPVMLLPKP